MKITDRRPGLAMQDIGITPSEDLMRDRERYIAGLVTRGIRTPDCVGIHGTSLEAIEYLIEHGKLLGNTSNTDGLKLGELYFNPRVHRLPKMHQFFQNSYWSETFETASGRNVSLLEDCMETAKYTSMSHSFLNNLGLLDKKDLFYKAWVLMSSEDPPLSGVDWEADEYFVDFTNLGYSNEKLLKTIGVAKRRKGVLIGLHESVLRDFHFENGNDMLDLKILVPTGLDISYLSGLRPLGSEERVFFRQLQHK